MPFYGKKKKKKFTGRNCIPSLLWKFSKKKKKKKRERKEKKKKKMNLEMMEKAICRHFLYTIKNYYKIYLKNKKFTS